MESLKNRGKKSFDLSNERSDRFCFGIKENDASKIFQEFDERFMEDFAGFLIITASVLLCELSFEKFDKLRLQQDFMQGDEDFNDHEHNLTQGIDKPDTVLDFELFSEQLLVCDHLNRKAAFSKRYSTHFYLYSQTSLKG